MSLRYTKEHEWVRVDGDVATCGISAFAADKLGDVVYVELPPEGVLVTKDKEMAVVE
jgi:glycine cleavage system H protein